MKKLILLLVCLVMSLSVSFADDADFTIKNGILIKYTGKDEVVKIPEGVTSIGYGDMGAYSSETNTGIFGNGSKIKSVILPESLEYIGWNAFKKCDKLEEITINSNIKNIGYNAFEGCTSLRSIDLTKVKAIGSAAFYNCSNLTSVKASASTLKSSWNSSEKIFQGTNIRSVEMVGEAIEDYRNGMFLSELMDTTWGNAQSTIFINNCLLKYTTNESNVIIPNNVKVLGHNAVDTCPNMRYLSIPKNVIRICIDKNKLTNCNLIVTRYSAAEQYAITNKLQYSVVGSVSDFQVGMNNFTKKQNYSTNQFRDVKASDWYSVYVKKCYELGLVSGKSNNYFGAQDNISIAEVITLAAKINSIYNGTDIDLTRADTEKWYMPYVRYAQKSKIVCDFDYYGRPAMRKEIVQILESSLPSKEWEKINNVTSIPDVNYTDNISSAQKDSIFNFFNAGIVAGNNEYGIFYPGLPVIRAEVSTIVSKIADKSLRAKVSLKASEMVVVNGNAKTSAVNIDKSKAMPKDLTIDEVMKINDNKKPVYEYKSNGELAYLSGKFSTTKVENAGQAIEALNSLRTLLKIKDSRTEFTFDRMEDSTNYRLQKVVNGKAVSGSYVILGVNKQNYPIFVLNK